MDGRPVVHAGRLRRDRGRPRADGHPGGLVRGPAAEPGERQRHPRPGRGGPGAVPRCGRPGPRGHHGPTGVGAGVGDPGHHRPTGQLAVAAGCTGHRRPAQRCRGRPRRRRAGPPLPRRGGHLRRPGPGLDVVGPVAHELGHGGRAARRRRRAVAARPGRGAGTSPRHPVRLVLARVQPVGAPGGPGLPRARRAWRPGGSAPPHRRLGLPPDARAARGAGGLSVEDRPLLVRTAAAPAGSSGRG
ncbi:hypothetical protein [Ornithinimicrobium kibberense]|uniref:hypothetical protein n=1 Tax=Ornithinimicrobium kibberense TaxID=282060 RepID=UPI00360B0E21